MKRPRAFPNDAFTELQATVARGRYERFDDLRQIPSALSRVAAFPSEANFRTAVVMASNSSQHPPTIGGVSPASSNPVFRVCTVRADQHGTSGQRHLNKDDVLIYRDTAGYAWQLYAHDQPGHYKQLTNDSSLSLTLDQHRWPQATSGTLESLASQGALVGFSTRSGRRGAA